VITVADVTKGFGGRVLFENVNVSFSPGNNYGLTGPNGSGKSTFMKLLIGVEDTDQGTVRCPERTAWLRQDHTAFDDHRVMDTVIMGNKRLWSAMAKKEEIYAKGDDISDEDGELLGDLECVVAEEDGYMAEADAAILLEGLGVGAEVHYSDMKQVQGGMKLRILLAQALFGGPEALLLDEPTNHLDLDSIRWLEDFLVDYEGTLVVISHDRRFLNAVCNQIADIDYNAIITYAGNYDDMVRAKAQIRGRLEKESSEKHAKIKQLQEFISKFGAGTRASQTKSRAKQISKLRPDEIKRSNIIRPYIRFTCGEEPSGRDVLEISNLSKSYGNHQIFHGLHSQVRRGDKVAIIGRNGVGKTTVMDCLAEKLEASEGTVRWGHNVRLGYLPQNHEGQIAAGSTVYEWLFSHRPEKGEQEVRAVLGRMLFSGHDGKKPTGTLSGGEQMRLLMCRLILMEYNVLLLDEPTNHLDLESISALRDAIEAYDGTVFFVTHDRDLASVASRVLAYANDDELIDYDGKIDDYLEWYDRHAKKSA